MNRVMPTFAINYNTAFLGAEPDRLLAVARQAEQSGFEALYVAEHVALYAGAKMGAWELPTDLVYLDPLEVLTYVAAGTERLLLGTAVLLLPYHHPVHLAKRLASVDALSGGRMRLLTVGVGALPGEAAAVGVDYPSRGRRADEAIDVMRLLWAEHPAGATFHGEFFDLESVFSYPKPLSGDGLPVHVGGSSTAAAKRAGLRGDGWFPGGSLNDEERRAQWDLVRSTAEAAGRDPEAIPYTRMGSVDMSEERVEQLVAQGATRIVVGAPAGEPDEQCAQLVEFAKRFGIG